MAHISSIGAGMFSDLSVANLAGAVPATYDAAGFAALFSTETTPADATPVSGEFLRIKNVREFPAMGTPPNIVNVPTYGQKSSQQVQGQSDAPSLEITINYVPADWDAGKALGKMVGDGKQYAFRFALMNAEPTGYASTAGGVGTVENSLYYWIGKIEALLVNPQLTDANTATLTLSLQSKFYGAWTV